MAPRRKAPRRRAKKSFNVSAIELGTALSLSHSTGAAQAIQTALSGNISGALTGMQTKIMSDKNKIIGTWERDTSSRITFFSDETAYWRGEEYCYELDTTNKIITLCWCTYCDNENYLHIYEYNLKGDTLILGGIQYVRIS